jgi:predicted DNA-binding ribbon-helix-helix protein
MLVKHSISIKGHRTSYSLEPEFHEELQRLSERDAIPLARLIARIDLQRDGETNLSSALRLYVLRNLREAADTSRNP